MIDRPDCAMQIVEICLWSSLSLMDATNKQADQENGILLVLEKTMLVTQIFSDSEIKIVVGKVILKLSATPCLK